MPRKKVSDDQNLAENFDDLPPGEKIVIQDTRTIEKKVALAAATETAAAHTANTDDEEPDENGFSDNSIAALLAYGEENIENQYCTIAIRRNPDGLNDNFLTPCRSLLNLAPLRNIELSADRMDIEEIVRNEYGGGHYFFQVHFDGSLRTSWKTSLGDSPVAIEKAKQDALNANKPLDPTPTPPAASPAANPFDQFFETLKKQKEMKEMLFGDEIKELETLRQRDRERQTDSAASEPPSDLSLLLKHTDSPHFEKLMDRFLPAEKSSLVKDVVEGAKEILPLGAEIGGFVRSLLTGEAAEQTDDLAAMMKETPPASTQLPAKPATSNFKRNKPAAPGEQEK